MLESAGYIASFCMGAVLGLIGAGGSILAIPILVYLFSTGVVEATAYSLFIVGITSFTGAVQRYNTEMLDIKVGLIFGIPSVIAVFSTRMWIVPSLPDIIFQIDTFILTKRLLILGLFSILVIAASIFMIRRKAEFSPDSGRPNLLALALHGILIGFITGLVGVGGGFLIMPSLFFLAKIPIKTAIGTALFVIAIKSLIGFIGDIPNQSIDWLFLMRISLISMLGILLGTQYSKKISGSWLKKAFGWFALTVGISILINESFL